MNFVKSLLLGSAAGLVAVAGAQAADLPAKAKAVEYVKVCDAFGAGFYFIPGTDTCLRVGGYVRVDYYFANTGTQAAIYPGAAELTQAGGTAAGNVSYDRADHLSTTRARAALDLDARTRTEYGTLRSYSRFYATNTTGNTSAGTAAALTLERAFIQFAGFTFGYTQSFFDYSTGLGVYNTLHVGSNRWNTVLAYTAQLGNGLSLTLSAEDANNRRNGIHSAGGTIALNNSNGNPNGTVPGGPNDNVNYTDGTNWQAGNAMPDIVAAIRVDQSWGSAQLSGAIHQLRGNQSRNSALGQAALDYETDYGWAVGAGITFNLDMIAKGDQLMITGSWADGAIEYTGVSGSVAGSRGSLGLVKGQSGAIVDLADAYVDFFGQLQTVEAWTIRADFRHFWTPTLRSTVFGGYTSVDVPFVCGDAACTSANARTATGSTGAGTVAGGGVNSTARDFDLFQVGVNTTWSPVRNLDIGVEVLYSEVQAKNNNANPFTAVGTFDEGIWAGTLRVQRSF